jgi:hypothetical protein
MVSDRDRRFWLFLFGLVGILGSGVLIGMGADNWWAMATLSSSPLGQLPPHSSRGIGVFFVVPALLMLCDLVAVSMTFVAGVIVVQRWRGRL